MSMIAQNIGRNVLDFFAYVGGLTQLSLLSVFWSIAAPLKKIKGVSIRHLVVQMARVGFFGLPIVMIVMFALGIILAMQMEQILREFGATRWIGSITGISIIRELGPLLTACVMTGHVGASIAAEIGTMNVSEEIEALRASAIDPIRFLVVPRVIAAAFMIGFVAIIGSFVGIVGGGVAAMFFMKVSPELYYKKVFEAITYKDLLTSVFKSIVFGFSIGIISCFEGMNVENGAEGVGRAATRSVVISIVAIIVVDCFLTAIFYVI